MEKDLIFDWNIFYYNNILYLGYILILKGKYIRKYLI